MEIPALALSVAAVDPCLVEVLSEAGVAAESWSREHTTAVVGACLADRSAEQKVCGPIFALQNLHIANLYPPSNTPAGSTGPNNSECCQQSGADWTRVACCMHYPSSALLVVQSREMFNFM